jgi:hypothetical protein
MNNLWYRTPEEWISINRLQKLSENFVLMLYLDIGSDGWDEIRTYLLNYICPRNYNDYESFLEYVGPGIYNHNTGLYLKTNKFCISTSLAHKLFYQLKDSIPESSELNTMAEEYKILSNSAKKLPHRTKYGPNGTHERWN